MDVNINLNLPEPVNKTLSSIGESVGLTISTIWNGVWAPATTWALKRSYKAQQNFLAYKQTVESELAKIEPKNFTEPRTSLIGPAIEASKYYIDEPDIRLMFAKLIAADMDLSKKNDVHHSFVEIIKQMSPIDAKVFIDLENPLNLMWCKLHLKNSPDMAKFITDIYLSQNFHEYSHNVCLSISNLVRLGLIFIPTRNTGSIIMGGNDPDILERFKKTHFYNELIQDIASPSSIYSSYEVVTYEGLITELGVSFRKICLS